MSNKLKKITNDLQFLNDLEILEICIVIFEYWGQNLIRNNSEVFRPEIIGFNSGLTNAIAIIFYSLYKKENHIKESNPKDLLKIDLSTNSYNFIENFKKLDFLEKVEFIEIIIRKYGNNTLFKYLQLNIPIMDNKTEDEIADEIAKYINKFNEKE